MSGAGLEGEWLCEEKCCPNGRLPITLRSQQQGFPVETIQHVEMAYHLGKAGCP